jgi:3-deoxy-D-manno-octulosonic-acid transferase
LIDKVDKQSPVRHASISMRIAYAIATYLLSPVYAFYWFFRGLSERAYLDRFGQRFGYGYPNLRQGCIWIHAVSVGEVQAAVPLVRALAKRFPDKDLLVTTVTPTGAARAQAVFGDSVSHSYIPFETPHSVANFFDATNPQLALIMETEIWPNLYYTCGQRKIPLILVSARISSKSVRRYRWLLPLFSETLSYGIVIAAQSQTDADRFISLGAGTERTSVTGNIKFDIQLPDNIRESGEQFRDKYLGKRPVWIAASTHDKEEELVLKAHRLVTASLPDALLVLVPRHPERFSSVRSLLNRRQVSFVSRTSGDVCTPETSVFLGDTMGEVPMFYAASDVAFVAGTLVPIGGHNLLEPAALGRPIVTGPFLFNTQDIADMFAGLGASIVVNGHEDLARTVRELITDRRKASEMGSKGRDIVTANRGSLKRLLVLLEPLIADVRPVSSE